MKLIFNQHTKRHFKVGGRKQSSPEKLHHEFQTFRTRKRIQFPISIRYSALALALLLGNDKFGDCVEAAGYHIIGVETENAKAPAPVTEDWALQDYSAITGFNPHKPETDQGTDPASALAYWEKTGFRDGTLLSGHVAVDAESTAQMKEAFFVCENLFVGMNLPDEWVAGIDTMTNDTVWDVAGDSNPQNGHMVAIVGYTQDGLLVSTWGLIILMKWAAAVKYASVANGGECYALLTPDQVEKGKKIAPNGLTWDALIVAFDTDLGGKVPEPAPEPVPVPVPVHVPGDVTLAQATEWALKPFEFACTMLSPGHVVKLIEQSLKRHWPKGKL